MLVLGKRGVTCRFISSILSKMSAGMNFCCDTGEHLYFIAADGCRR
jgi:hypothetical protein